MEQLKGKTIGFLLSHEFEDIEVLYPVLRLSEEGAWITIITVDAPGCAHPRPLIPNKPITGRFGHTVPLIVMEEGNRYDIKHVSQVNADEFDAIIIPGGFSPDFVRTDEHALTLIKEINKKDKVIAAVCHGAAVMVSAGILKGKRVTAWKSAKDELILAGAIFEDTAMVRDGNIVTARVPDDLPQFCKGIMDAMLGK
jgi:protease I